MTLVCPSCGSSAWDVVDEESEECNCSGCGLDFALTDAVGSEDALLDKEAHER